MFFLSKISRKYVVFYLMIGNILFFNSLVTRYNKVNKKAYMSSKWQLYITIVGELSDYYISMLVLSD